MVSAHYITFLILAMTSQRVGPPGTGKTTAISEAASIWLGKHIATWMVAHSNVAVKNIAEKLFMKNVDFRILVSKDFHFEWWAGVDMLLPCSKLTSTSGTSIYMKEYKQN